MNNMAESGNGRLLNVQDLKVQFRPKRRYTRCSVIGPLTSGGFEHGPYARGRVSALPYHPHH